LRDPFRRRQERNTWRASTSLIAPTPNHPHHTHGSVVCTTERAPGAPPQPTRRHDAIRRPFWLPGPGRAPGSERRSSAYMAASTDAPAPGRARLTGTFGAMPDSDPPPAPCPGLHACVPTCAAPPAAGARRSARGLSSVSRWPGFSRPPPPPWLLSDRDGERRRRHVPVPRARMVGGVLGYGATLRRQPSLTLAARRRLAAHATIEYAIRCEFVPVCSAAFISSGIDKFVSSLVVSIRIAHVLHITILLGGS